MHPLTLGDVVRGQYDSGVVAEKAVAAYRKEENVASDSNVETFVAMRLLIDNWRWAGVPFYLRTGKRLAARSSEIAIRFKRAPHALFRETPVEELDADWLIMRIQPDESIRLRFNAKRPGPAMALESVAMDFKYKDWFQVELSNGSSRGEALPTQLSKAICEPDARPATTTCSRYRARPRIGPASASSGSEITATGARLSSRKYR